MPGECTAPDAVHSCGAHRNEEVEQYVDVAREGEEEDGVGANFMPSSAMSHGRWTPHDTQELHEVEMAPCPAMSNGGWMLHNTLVEAV